MSAIIISIKVSSWLAAHSQKLLFALNMSDIIQPHHEMDMSSETFFRFTEDEEIYTPSTMTEQLFAKTTICPLTQDLD